MNAERGRAAPGAAGRRPPKTIAIVVKGWPRLSETFIAQEVLGLERRGLDIVLVSLRRPTDKAVHALNRAVRAPVLYLPEYLHEAPIRVLRALVRARRLAGFGAALRLWFRDLRRDPTRNRVRRFGQAAVAAVELGDGIGHLYAHFLHTPASVARYAALMRGLPWSVSAHAKDIWTTPEWEKREKLGSAAWSVTCTGAGHGHLAALAPEASVDLVYHGLDFARFPPPPERKARDGGDPTDPVVVLSVGRAVEKKGFDDVLAALARLPAALNWRWVHVGGGPLLDGLKRRAAGLGLGDRIEWRGPLAQDDVIAAYRAADLFVLASRVAADGDRDGLPNVLMEAQSQGLACVATAVAAIPELIDHGATGLLVPQGDPAALADALAGLIAAPARRAALGTAGCARVRGTFRFEHGLDLLAQRFGLAERAAPEPLPLAVAGE